MSEQVIKVRGAVKKIHELQVISEKFKKKLFEIEIPGKYPQQVVFEVVQDKVELLDGLREGDIIEVCFNIRGNQYKGKTYNNLQAWEIATIQGEEAPKAALSPATADLPSDDSDDLPF